MPKQRNRTFGRNWADKVEITLKGNYMPWENNLLRI
jgi:hypothetical protein